MIRFSTDNFTTTTSPGLEPSKNATLPLSFSTTIIDSTKLDFRRVSTWSLRIRNAYDEHVAQHCTLGCA